MLYSKYIEIEKNFKPGDEWGLVRRFIEDLKCASYCTIVESGDHVHQDDEVEQAHAQSNRTFHERVSSGNDPALNMAITMYMVAAIKELREKSLDDVRKIAFEIAMLGCSGISPDKKSGYAVPSLGSRDMSGSQMLAYYYVSWKIAIPERVEGLGLPFSNEYANAQSIVDFEN